MWVRLEWLPVREQQVGRQGKEGGKRGDARAHNCKCPLVCQLGGSMLDVVTCLALLLTDSRILHSVGFWTCEVDE